MELDILSWPRMAGNVISLWVRQQSWVKERAGMSSFPALAFAFHAPS